MFGLDKKFYKVMKIVYENGWIGKEAYLRITNTYKYNGILTCEICKQPINNQSDNKKFSIDHILSRALGGNGNLENLRVAHRKCNNERKEKVKGNYYKVIKINKVTKRTIYRGYNYENAIKGFDKNKELVLEGERIEFYINYRLEFEYKKENVNPQS